MLQKKQWNLGQYNVFHEKVIFIPKYKRYGQKYSVSSIY